MSNSNYFDNKNALFMEPTVTQYGSHMVMTNVSKPTKKQYVNIDTRFRDDYDPKRTANYNISLPERIREVKTVRVTNIEIPITFYNISANLGNNCFNITVIGEVRTVLIPDGQYDTDSLVTTVNQVISEIGVPYTNIQFLVENNYCIFENIESNNNYYIDFDVNNQGTFDMQNLSFKLGWILGFREPSYVVPPLTILSALYFLDLHGPRYLYLVMDEFQNYNPQAFVSLIKTSEVNKNVLARISMSPYDYPFGTIMPANSCSNGLLMSSYRIYTEKNDLLRMNIQLVNERGVAMDLNGMDFSFCMEFEHE